jgi:hypothetical protein
VRQRTQFVRGWTLIVIDHQDFVELQRIGGSGFAQLLHVKGSVAAATENEEAHGS